MTQCGKGLVARKGANGWWRDGGRRGHCCWWVGVGWWKHKATLASIAMEGAYKGARKQLFGAAWLAASPQYTRWQLGHASMELRISSITCVP